MLAVVAVGYIKVKSNGPFALWLSGSLALELHL